VNKCALLQYRRTTAGKFPKHLGQGIFNEAGVVQADGVLCGGVVLRYREQSVSVQLVVCCGAVWYCGTESGVLVCNWWYIVDKLMCMLDSCVFSPHIICLLEYYLRDHKLLMIKPYSYYLSSRFSRHSYTCGGVCMYIKSFLESDMTDLS